MSATKEKLVERFADPSPEVRRRAARKLSDLPVEEIRELVISALADDDWRVRKEAIAYFEGAEGAEIMADELIDDMVQEENVGLRNAASEALTALGSPAVDRLLERYEGMAPGGRKIALEVVGRCEDPRSTGLLVDAIQDKDENVRVCAVELLGEKGDGPAREALIACLAEGDFLITLAALQSLNKIGAKVPFASLEPLVGEPIFGSEILFALGRSGEPRAAGFIVERIPAEPRAVRSLEVLHAAGNEAAAAVEEALAEASSQVHTALHGFVVRTDSSEQRAAARCLMWARKKEHIPPLVALVGDEAMHRVVLEGLSEWGADAREVLVGMLPTLQGRPLGSVVGLLARILDEEEGKAQATLFSAYLSSTDIVVATAAAGAVARFGNETVIPRLLEMVRSEDARVRRAAGHALVQIGLRHPEAVREALFDKDIDGPGGIELCRAFEVVGRPEDLGVISAALSSPLPELRRAVIGALAGVAGAAAVGTISLAMTDEDVRVQMAAAAALARIGPAAGETIVSALNTAEGPLRAALVKALGKVGHIEAASILMSMCDESSDVAIAALEAMGNLGLDPAEVQEKILGHRDDEVVKKALSQLSSAVTSEQLMRLLSHPSWDVRLSVTELASARVAQDRELARAIEDRLEREEDDLVRISMERALKAEGRKSRP